MSKVKFTIDIDILEILVPGSYRLSVLPRKKKKALKKLITKTLIRLSDEHAKKIIDNC